MQFCIALQLSSLRQNNVAQNNLKNEQMTINFATFVLNYKEQQAKVYTFDWINCKASIMVTLYYFSKNIVLTCLLLKETELTTQIGETCQRK